MGLPPPPPPAKIAQNTKKKDFIHTRHNSTGIYYRKVVYTKATAYVQFFNFLMQLLFECGFYLRAAYMLLLRVPFSNIMLLISTCGSHRLRTSRHEAESQGGAVHQRGEALYEQRQRVGTEPNVVQPLSLTPFVVFQKALLTLSLSYLLGTKARASPSQ